VQGLFGHHDFSPEESLASTPNIDPHLVPRVAMSNENIDVHLLNELGKLGLKRGKLITRESHPELIVGWNAMCARAGMQKAPQLILTENKAPNALTVSPEEVVVTTGLLKMLNLREINAVLGHELGHEISNHKKPRIIATALFGGAGALAGHRLGLHLGASRWSKGSVLLRAFDEFVCLSIGAFLGGIVANNIAVRPTELDADAKGARISGDPEALISALQKLQAAHPTSALGKLAQIRSGYPSTETRIEKLREIAAQMQPQTAPVTTTAQPTLPTTQPTHAVSHITPSARLEAVPAEHIAVG
jgi:Zn-dependent protease with chaperone function